MICLNSTNTNKTKGGTWKLLLSDKIYASLPTVSNASKTLMNAIPSSISPVIISNTQRASITAEISKQRNRSNRTVFIYAPPANQSRGVLPISDEKSDHDLLSQAPAAYAAVLPSANQSRNVNQNSEEKNDHGPAIRGLPQESVGVPQHVIKLNNKQVKVPDTVVLSNRSLPSTGFLNSLSKEYVDPDIMVKICGLDINDGSTLASSLYQRVFNINRNNSHLAYQYPERYYFKLNNITRKQNEYTYEIDDLTFSTSIENFNQLIKDGLIFREKTKEELKKWYNFSGGDKKTKKHKRSIYGKHSKKHVRRAKKRTHHKTKRHRK